MVNLRRNRAKMTITPISKTSVTVLNDGVRKDVENKMTKLPNKK
jgi:hypothetical protein